MDRLVLDALLAQPVASAVSAPGSARTLLIVAAGLLLLVALGALRRMLEPLWELFRALLAAIVMALLLVLVFGLLIASLWV